MAGLSVVGFLITPRVRFALGCALCALVLSGGGAGQIAEGEGRVRDPNDVIVDVRLLLKKGLLGKAERQLSELTQEAPQVVRATGKLLAGNIAFERGEYMLADQLYKQSEALYRAEVSSSGYVSDSLRALSANRQRVSEALSRRLSLIRLATGLQRLALSFVAIIVVAVFLLGRFLLRRSRAVSPMSPDLKTARQ